MKETGSEMNTTIFKTIAAAILATLASASAQADWHSGQIESLYVAYDGSTVTMDIVGWDRTNCTCYPTWATNMCLDRSRMSFKEELALAYSAKARGKAIAVNIDETTCKVIAIGENQ